MTDKVTEVSNDEATARTSIAPGKFALVSNLQQAKDLNDVLVNGLDAACYKEGRTVFGVAKNAGELTHGDVFADLQQIPMTGKMMKEMQRSLVVIMKEHKTEFEGVEKIPFYEQIAPINFMRYSIPIAVALAGFIGIPLLGVLLALPALAIFLVDDFLPIGIRVLPQKVQEALKAFEKMSDDELGEKLSLSKDKLVPEVTSTATPKENPDDTTSKAELAIKQLEDTLHNEHVLTIDEVFENPVASESECNEIELKAVEDNKKTHTV